jgi:Phage portal protein, SPP1 Gp6-like
VTEQTPRQAILNGASRNGATPRGNPNDDIKWALEQHSERRDEYTKYRNYYDGKQARMIDEKQEKTTFGQKFAKFRVNFCRPVVGALADRLQINGFTSPAEEEEKRAIEAAKREMEKRPAMPSPAEQWDQAGGTLGAATQQRQQQPGAATPGATQGPTRASSEPSADAAAQERPTPRQGNAPPPPQPPVPPDAITEEQRQAEIDNLDASMEGVPSASEEAWDIWIKNRMPRRAGQIHQEAIAAGDAYLIVWPNDSGFPVFHPQKAHEMRVEYDPENPGMIKKAAKMWREDITINGQTKKGIRLNLYFTDRIEKYAAAKPDEGYGKKLKPEDFKPYSQPQDPWRVAHSYERVPVFHFSNDADLGEYGRSELADATPIQDWINKTAFDLLVGQEMHAFPQRYLLNIEDPRAGADALELGADKIWALRSAADDATGPAAQVGQFPSAELGGLTNVLNQGAQAMAVTTGTPIHHFLPTLEGPSTPASGESQKTSDTKLQMKVSDRQVAFEDVWAEAVAFAVRVQRDVSINEAIELNVEWSDLRPRVESEEVNIAINKQKAGVTWQRTLKEMGYNDDDLEEFEHQKQQNAFNFSAPVSGSPMAGQPTVEDAMDMFGQATGLEQ